MKAMRPSGFQYYGLVATHALGHMMYGGPVHELPQAQCGDNRETTLIL